MVPRERLMRDLQAFRRRLQASGQVDLVMLFGSQATGRAGPESDVDLVVVSAAFEGRNFVERCELVDRAWDLAYPVDFLCYTPSEFERLRHQVSIVRVALDEGVPVEG